MQPANQPANLYNVGDDHATNVETLTTAARQASSSLPVQAGPVPHITMINSLGRHFHFRFLCCSNSLAVICIGQDISASVPAPGPVHGYVKGQMFQPLDLTQGEGSLRPTCQHFFNMPFGAQSFKLRLLDVLNMYVNTTELSGPELVMKSVGPGTWTYLGRPEHKCRFARDRTARLKCLDVTAVILTRTKCIVV